jgi:membrane protein DedA with SNARE-associated domain
MILQLGLTENPNDATFLVCEPLFCWLRYLPPAYRKDMQVDIAQLVQQFGYLAIAIGSFLEGEAVLLAGSFAASQGYLELFLVFPIAAVASFLGDLPYFYAGRRYGDSVIERFPSLHCHKGRLENLLHRHHVLMVLTLRFLYGVRIPGLLTLGMSTLPSWRFLTLNFFGALIWAAGICAAGYGAGRVITGFFDRMDSAEQAFMLIVILVGSLMLAMLLRRKMAQRECIVQDKSDIRHQRQGQQ